MNKTSKRFQNIFLRYLILILVAIPNLWLFYLILTPLTIYPVYFILNLLFEISLVENTLKTGCFSIEIINACVAGSAYYLLLILNLATPKIKLKKRITMLAYAFAAFLIINILRIVLLSTMFIFESPILDVTHELFWYERWTLSP